MENYGFHNHTKGYEAESHPCIEWEVIAGIQSDLVLDTKWGPLYHIQYSQK